MVRPHKNINTRVISADLIAEEVQCCEVTSAASCIREAVHAGVNNFSAVFLYLVLLVL